MDVFFDSPGLVIAPFEAPAVCPSAPRIRVEGIARGDDGYHLVVAIGAGIRAYLGPTSDEVHRRSMLVGLAFAQTYDGHNGVPDAARVILWLCGCWDALVEQGCAAAAQPAKPALALVPRDNAGPAEEDLA